MDVSRIGRAPDRNHLSPLRVGLLLDVVVEQHGVRLLILGPVADQLPEKLLESLIVALFAFGQRVGELKIRRGVAELCRLGELVDRGGCVVLVEQRKPAQFGGECGVPGLAGGIDQRITLGDFAGLVPFVPRPDLDDVRAKRRRKDRAGAGRLLQRRAHSASRFHACACRETR